MDCFARPNEWGGLGVSQKRVAAILAASHLKDGACERDRPPELNALAADPSFRRLAPFLTPNMGFGTSVDLSADGKFLVVGAEQGGWRRPEDAINGENATGGAYLYELANQGCDPIFLGMPGRYLNEFGQPLQGALGSRQGKSVSVENRGNNGFVLAGISNSDALAGYATLAEIRSNQFRSETRSTSAQ